MAFAQKLILQDLTQRLGVQLDRFRYLGYISPSSRVKAKIAVAGKLVATLAVAAAFSFKTGGLLMAIFKGVTIGVALVRRMVAVTPMLQVAGITSGNPSFYD